MANELRKSFLFCSLMTGCLLPPPDSAEETTAQADEAATDTSDSGGSSDTGGSSDAANSSDTDGSSESEASGDTDGSSDTGGSRDTGESESTTDTGEPAPAVSIYAIRAGEVPIGTAVQVDGVWVTALADDGFFAQELEGGQHSGMFVRVSEIGPYAIGDLVDLDGEVALVAGQTELDASLGSVVITDTLAPPPSPDLLSPEAVLDPAWAGVLVRVGGTLEVAQILGGDFEVSEGDALIGVDDRFFDVPDDDLTFPDFGIGARFTAIVGILDGTNGPPRLAPRAATDLYGYLALLAIGDLIAGDLVVTEVMYDPTGCAMDAGCEWIELFNTRPARIDLTGLIVQDENLGIGSPGQGIVSTAIVVEPGEYVWLGQTEAGWPYASLPDRYYGPKPAFNNDNTGDRVVIRGPFDVILDQTPLYAPQAGVEGVSWQLVGPPSAIANDDPAKWCNSSAEFEGEFATPGEPNTDCPP